MKRVVEREKNLPAFSICVGELEVLWERMAGLFYSSKRIYSSINVALPSEKLEFADVEELKRHSQLKGEITTFHIHISQGSLTEDHRTVSIRSGDSLVPRAQVRASAPTEAWCAGAIEVVHSFLLSHRVWYHWFLSAPLGILLVLLFNLPTIAAIFVPKEMIYQKSILIPWLVLTLALFMVYLGKGKLLPGATLRITDEDGFIRRHIGELSLLVALIGLILTLIKFFMDK